MVRQCELCGNGAGYAVAHGAVGGSEEAVGAAKLEVSLTPDTEVAGANGDHRVVDQGTPQIGHDLVHANGRFGVAFQGKPFTVNLVSPLQPLAAINVP